MCPEHEGTIAGILRPATTWSLSGGEMLPFEAIKTQGMGNLLIGKNLYYYYAVFL